MSSFWPDGEHVPWTEHTTADPLADIRGAAEAIGRNSGTYAPGTYLVSSTTYHTLELLEARRELLERFLAETPWWHFMQRAVWERELHGRWRRRTRLLRWQRRLAYRWRSRKWEDEY